MLLKLKVDAPAGTVCIVAASGLKHAVCFSCDSYVVFKVCSGPLDTRPISARVCALTKNTGSVTRLGTALLEFSVCGALEQVFPAAESVECTMSPVATFHFFGDNVKRVNGASILCWSDFPLSGRDMSPAAISSEARREAQFRKAVLQACNGNKYLTNMFTRLDDYRVESFGSNVYGSTLPAAFVASNAYIVDWLLAACNLYILITGFDVVKAKKQAFSYAEGSTVYSNLLALCVGPYRQEKLDCNSSSVLRGMTENDCNHQAVTACTLHPLVVKNCNDIIARIRSAVLWNSFQSATADLVCKAVQWACDYTTGECHMPIMYTDANLKYKLVPFSPEQELSLELHQGVFLELRSPRESGISRQYVEMSGLYECGPELCHEWFWNLFKWPHSARPSVGTNGVLRFDCRRYKSVVCMESFDLLTILLTSAGALPGWSFDRACRPYNAVDVARVPKLNSDDAVVDVVLSLDDWYVNSRFTLAAPPPFSRQPYADPFFACAAVSAFPAASEGGAGTFIVGPGSWSVGKVDATGRARPVRDLFSIVHTL